MGLFNKIKRSLGYQDTKLRKRGIEGTGKVLSSTKTAMHVEDGPYVYKVTVLVTIPDREPYEVTCKIEGSPTEGETYPVYVDPKDPENVFLDKEQVDRDYLAQRLKAAEQQFKDLRGQ